MKPKEKNKKNFEKRFFNWWWDYDPDTMTMDVVKEFVIKESKFMRDLMLQELEGIIDRNTDVYFGTTDYENLAEDLIKWIEQKRRMKEGE